ncbi:hypothetical protein [Marinitoga sp. 1155]|uniref:hypothetical protein n=1 Tax=Marinitoga sp. 1155 TaxID=1428448 RepID=UPI000659E32E|nr:hypothetical protein [Marinitoga sp. 1155]KLO24222.1 hypothetical protein X274_04345 [Marinitoga sp. 1155]
MKKKFLHPYYLLFILTLLLIVITIIINYNSNYSFDPEYIKELPWNKRTSYIKQKELLIKLEGKNNFNDEDIILINQLISISTALKDDKTLKIAQKYKLDFLLYSIKNLMNDNSIYDYINNIDFKTKMQLFLLSNNNNYISNLIKNMNKKEKLQMLFILKIFYPEKFNNLKVLFDKKDIEDIESIIKYINLKGE